MSVRHEIPTQPEPGSSSRGRRKRRRKKRRLGVPAPVVFYTVGVLATMSVGLLYLMPHDDYDGPSNGTA